MERFPTLDKYFPKDFAESANPELKDPQVDLAKLTDFQRAVFKVLGLHHSSFEPYSEGASGRRQSRNGESPGISTVQKALEALRVKGFVWKASFGTYVVENENYLPYYGVNNATELQPGASI